jgi:hypothetical protein
VTHSSRCPIQASALFVDDGPESVWIAPAQSLEERSIE